MDGRESSALKTLGLYGHKPEQRDPDIVLSIVAVVYMLIKIRQPDHIG